MFRRLSLATSAVVLALVATPVLGLTIAASADSPDSGATAGNVAAATGETATTSVPQVPAPAPTPTGDPTKTTGWD
ncbi:hypothetical protein ACFQ6N_03115 [Kitasatospora sp. NPDC056446]|uniref:hypothetical protein n=1 Tax=Kitasatospora sp. NPDC056446 TaxID=3345819 RepID=UPI003682F8A5